MTVSSNPSYNPHYSPSAPSAPPPGGHGAGGSSGGGAISIIDERATREYLTNAHWPQGLQETFLRNLSKIPIRFMICDDSGSMAADDGKRIISSGGHFNLVKCSRWNELTAALSFHVGLAQASGAITEFRMLNAAAPIVVGDKQRDPDGINARRMQDILQGSPNGGTPLCRHIREVTAQIAAMANQLRAAGQRAVVLIATDGESSDGKVDEALEPLKDLPAWVVIRLCTDDGRIVDYWNNIDETLELDMDVLDDLCGEAAEVNKMNPWLTYAEPMHRLREFGIPVKEIDLLDEKKLSLDQVRVFATLVFGGKADDYPHPEVDLDGFKRAVVTQSNLAGNVYSPVHRTMRPWINVNQIVAPGAGGCVLL